MTSPARMRGTTVAFCSSVPHTSSVAPTIAAMLRPSIGAPGAEQLLAEQALVDGAAAEAADLRGPARGQVAAARRAPGGSPSRASCRWRGPRSMISSSRCSAMNARTSARNASVSGVEPEVHAGRVGRAVAAAARALGGRGRRPPPSLGDHLQLVARVAEQQPGGLGPADVELHVVLEHEPVAAVHVEAEPGRLVGDLAAPPRGLGGAAPARWGRPRRAPTRPRRPSSRLPSTRVWRSAKRCWSAWKLPIGHAELVAVLGVLEPDVEGGARQPGLGDGGERPPLVERPGERGAGGSARRRARRRPARSTSATARPNSVRRAVAARTRR